MSTLKTDTLSNVAGSKSVPMATVVDGSAKAWVNFNGTGTVAIRAAFNVSSITDNGTGNYTLNFTSTFADANYAVALGSQRPTATAHMDYINRLTTAVTVRCIDDGGVGTAQDAAEISAAIFR